MRARKGRSIESLMKKLQPDAGSIPIADLVKRPSPPTFQRNRRLTPQQRLDRAFGLIEFATDLGKGRALRE